MSWGHGNDDHGKGKGGSKWSFIGDCGKTIGGPAAQMTGIFSALFTWLFDWGGWNSDHGHH